jgi:hypothetical protein
MLPHKDHHQRLVRRKRIKRSVVGLSRVPFDSTSRAQVARRKVVGTAKPKPGSRRDLEQKLGSLLAKRVKMRDGFRCRQCAFDGAPTQGLLDAGHIYPKGKFPGGKFLESNVVAQCRTHNTRHIARPEFMLTWYQAEHGPEALEALHALVLSMPRKMTVEWLAQAIEECEEAIADMELLAVA